MAERERAARHKAAGQGDSSGTLPSSPPSPPPLHYPSLRQLVPLQVEELYKELHMDPDKISRVTELGFTTQEARLGLRACNGDVSAAATYLTDRKEV